MAIKGNNKHSQLMALLFRNDWLNISGMQNYMLESFTTFFVQGMNNLYVIVAFEIYVHKSLMTFMHTSSCDVNSIFKQSYQLYRLCYFYNISKSWAVKAFKGITKIEGKRPWQEFERFN